MAESTVIEWDGTHLPTELHHLPPGRYLVEPLPGDDELTPEEEAGIAEAIDEIEAGKGIPWEDAFRELRNRAAQR
jgi:hypothetical protein